MMVPMVSSGCFLRDGRHSGRGAGGTQLVSVIPGRQHQTRNREIPGLVLRTHRGMKKPPVGGFFNSHQLHKGQCASAQTLFLVKYIMKAKMIRNTKTWKPSCLRASIFGSAAHIRNVVTSLAYWATVVGAPSSKVTCPSESGFGILMEWPGKYLL